jgi:hypothetical protein
MGASWTYDYPMNIDLYIVCTVKNWASLDDMIGQKCWRILGNCQVDKKISQKAMIAVDCVTSTVVKAYIYRKDLFSSKTFPTHNLDGSLFAAIIALIPSSSGLLVPQS